MVGFKHSQLKSKGYDEIQNLFDKEIKRVNTFVDINSEVVKGSETRTEESSKRAGDELEFDKSKKQKIDEHVEAKKYDDLEEEEMKKHMEIVQDEEEDLETLWKLVKEKHGINRPVEEYERVLWGDLKVMFEPDIKSEVWRNLQGYKVTVWKLFDNFGVYFVRKEEKIDDEETMDEEEDNEVTKELYDDVNVKLGNEDTTDMTNDVQGASEQQNVSQESRFEQVEEDAHVTLTPVLDTQKADEPV
ncbi:hypothetical protein Tco_0392956 [Tanacetum coccineum]